MIAEVTEVFLQHFSGLLLYAFLEHFQCAFALRINRQIFKAEIAKIAAKQVAAQNQKLAAQVAAQSQKTQQVAAQSQTSVTAHRQKTAQVAAQSQRTAQVATQSQQTQKAYEETDVAPNTEITSAPNNEIRDGQKAKAEGTWDSFPSEKTNVRSIDTQGCQSVPAIYGHESGNTFFTLFFSNVHR